MWLFFAAHAPSFCRPFRACSYRALPPKSPDAWTPLDPIWNKLYHALGAPDAKTLGRLMDPDDVGAVGRDRFVEILRVRVGVCVGCPVRGVAWRLCARVRSHQKDWVSCTRRR